MLRAIASAACDVYDACVLALRRVYLFITAYARLHYTRFPPPASDPAGADWTIHKVLAFCEDAPPLSDSDLTSSDFADVTEWFDINMWDIDVARTFPHWFKWKLEIRYTHRGEKFRHVIRPGEPLIWPPSTLPSDHDAAENSEVHEMSKPKGILSASLVPRPGIGASEVDITNRLRKYAGVTRDFATASEVRAHDAFPMDDNDWNAVRFRSIRIVKAHPVKCISVDDVNYAENGLINEKKKE